MALLVSASIFLTSQMASPKIHMLIGMVGCSSCLVSAIFEICL